MIGGQMYLPENSPDVENSKQDFDPIDKFLWANLPFSVQYNGGDRFRPARYMTDYLTDEAIDAIKANRNRPFFLYLAYNAPHTPLQALNLLNDPAFLEAAQSFALKIVTGGAGAGFASRLNEAYLQALGRPPSAAERVRLQAYFEKQQSTLSQDEQQLAQLAPVSIEGVKPSEMAAWTALSSVLMNLDEFITRE